VTYSFYISISLTYSWVTVEGRVAEYEQTVASCSFVPLEVYLWTVGQTHAQTCDNYNKSDNTSFKFHTESRHITPRGISQVCERESGTADGRVVLRSHRPVIWSHSWLTDSLPLSFSVERWAVSHWPHKHKSGSCFISIPACTVSKSMWTLLRTVPFTSGHKNFAFYLPPSPFTLSSSHPSWARTGWVSC